MFCWLSLLSPQGPWEVYCQLCVTKQRSLSVQARLWLRGMQRILWRREGGGSPAEGWGEGPWGLGCLRAAGREWGGECCFSRLLGCRAVGQEQAPSLTASPALGSGTAVRAQHCLLSPAGSGVSTAPVSCEHPVHHSHTPVPLCLFQHRVFVLVWF